MMLGLSLSAFTTLHVIISLVAILTGVIVLSNMAGNRPSGSLMEVFLATTVATSVTGFMFPNTGITPGIVVGAISIAVLAAALYALYIGKLSGANRWIFVVTATLALYLNVFVLIVQSFQKIGALNALAPTGSELPFKIVQIAALLAALWFGWRAVKQYHPLPDAA